MWNDENHPHYQQRSHNTRRTTYTTSDKLLKQSCATELPGQNQQSDSGILTNTEGGARRSDKMVKLKGVRAVGRRKDSRLSKDYSNKMSKESDTSYGNQKSPFVIELGKLDCELSYRTNNNIMNTRRALQFDSEIDQHLSQIYSFSNHILLVHANQILHEVQDSKKRATEEWLRSKTDEERTLYLSRNKTTATGYF